MTEQQLQSKIKKKLTQQGWLVIKLIKTSMNGIPDLMCLKNGELIFIEVKKDTGRLSKLQKYTQSELIKKGFTVKNWIDYECDFKS
jgi:Holliday junction resolvase